MIVRDVRIRLAVAVVLGAVLTSCSCASLATPSEPSDRPGESRFCTLLAVPFGQMEERHLTVAQVLTLRGKHGVGVRAGFTFLRIDEVPGAERFRPVLRYLAKRWSAESLHGDAQPDPPSAAVIENARELDRFVADGGCG